MAETGEAFRAVASARGVPIDQALNPKVQDSGAAKEIPSLLAAANPTLEYALHNPDRRLRDGVNRVSSRDVICLDRSRACGRR